MLPTYIDPDPNTADAGYVVVSEWRDAGDRPNRPSTLDYQHFDTLNGALEGYAEYRRGEYARAREVGIFAVDVCGLPLRRLDPNYLMRVMAEMERDRRAA